MFKNKHVFLTTGPSVFSNEIKLMVQNAFNAIPLYVNNDKEEDLEYLALQADALVLAGGNDVFRGTLGEPILHGEGLSKFDILRDKREINLINKFVEQGKPILAICRGFQLICAKYGFYLIPNIGGDIAHSLGEIKINLENGEFCHYVQCLPEYKDVYFKGNMGVNSYHHQGILFWNKKREIDGIKVVAISDTNSDKERNNTIVEIVESEQKKIVGMQFHPEADWEYGNLASLAVINRFKQML